MSLGTLLASTSRAIGFAANMAPVCRFGAGSSQQMNCCNALHASRLARFARIRTQHPLGLLALRRTFASLFGWPDCHP